MEPAVAHVSMTPREVAAQMVREYGPIEKIILFGSRARGEEDEMSDIDLIVIKETNLPFVRRMVEAPVFPVPVDVFVYTPEEFARMRDAENPFMMEALAHGRVLYDRTRAA